MEAGVGRGQSKGQLCTSCMLGNAVLTPPAPSPFRLCVFIHPPCTYSTDSTTHSRGMTSSHPLLSAILIHSSKLFSIFLISFFLNLSLTHSFTLSCTPAYLHHFHFLSLPTPPALFSLHSCFTFIFERRADLTVEYVQEMWFPSQVGLFGSRKKQKGKRRRRGDMLPLPLFFPLSLSLSRLR